MDALVLCQVGALAEGFAASITLVGPLACVYSLVLREVGAAAEGYHIPHIYKASPQYESSGAVSGGQRD